MITDSEAAGGMQQRNLVFWDISSDQVNNATLDEFMREMLSVHEPSTTNH